ncbi:MAG: class I SAM-dependent methyltransferase [Deltaproteobacteria bacterium]|nr:class I SAM-dependent methyltransferase [Deltaproteobacteria bacterium]
MNETTSPAAYDALMAERYDEDFEASFGGRDRGDVAFFRGLAAATAGTICEVGAGTGRMLLAIAEAVGDDRTLVGVEPSEAMRRRFEDKVLADPALASRVAIRFGTFEAIPLPDGAAGLVYAAFRSFQHVLDPAAQLRALIELQRVLAPGGVLALDLFDPSYRLLADAGPGRGLRYRTARGTIVERWESRRLRRADQIIEVTFRWVERRGRKIVKDLSESYAVRYTFPHELGHLLARAGLERALIQGDYDGRPIGEEARELIVVARKPS